MQHNPDYVIYSDGGARGNPGPAAYGFVVQDKQGNIASEAGVAIGRATNNVAEYRGMIEGLKALRKIAADDAQGLFVECRMDSELAVKQMRGEYKVKAENLKPLVKELKMLCEDFSSVRFLHVRREQNKEADKLVNQALDEK